MSTAKFNLKKSSLIFKNSSLILKRSTFNFKNSRLINVKKSNLIENFPYIFFRYDCFY